MLLIDPLILLCAFNLLFSQFLSSYRPYYGLSIDIATFYDYLIPVTVQEIIVQVHHKICCTYLVPEFKDRATSFNPYIYTLYQTLLLPFRDQQ